MALLFFMIFRPHVISILGNDIMRFGSDFISEASDVWESVLLNLLKWPNSFENHFVPALYPDQIILMSKVANQFASKSYALYGAKVLNDLDSMRPIDILFFGSSNPHRNDVYESFQSLAEDHGLNIKFFMDYSFFGHERELAIHQAKVVLNLANFKWPFTNMDRPERSSIPSVHLNVAEKCSAATNFHRVRSLLAHGKVVLSERTGSTIEEALLSDFVTFADTDDLTITALDLLRDPPKRFHLERAAVSYIVEDHSQEFVRIRNDLHLSSLSLLAKAITDLGGFRDVAISH